MPVKRMIAILTVVVFAGCSVLNREGPDVTCAQLSYGMANACKEGIIASCVNGKIVYDVCEEDDSGISAKELCEASFQTDGAFTCTSGGQPPRALKK